MTQYSAWSAVTRWGEMKCDVMNGIFWESFLYLYKNIEHKTQQLYIYLKLVMFSSTPIGFLIISVAQRTTAVDSKG